MFKLGLTGSIGMGKSTTLGFFADLGCAIWDADAAVHRLYAKDGAAVDPIRKIAPGAIKNNSVDRTELKSLLQSGDLSLQALEQIVHPLVAADRTEFASTSTAEIIVFDIPLLFETGSIDWFDGVAVVTAPADVQEQRVMARPGMTKAQFDLILSRQLPDAEKRSKADYIIETITLEAAQKQVKMIVDTIKKGQFDA